MALPQAAFPLRRGAALLSAGKAAGDKDILNCAAEPPVQLEGGVPGSLPSFWAVPRAAAAELREDFPSGC